MNQDDAQWAQKRTIYDGLVRVLESHVRCDPKWTVAEFGIGRWGFGRFYAERFQKVYGLDIEDYSAHHPNVEFVLSRGNIIPLPDRTVDLVTSHSVLEHCESLDQTISEIDRITKPGGYLFLTVSPLYFSSFGAHLYKDKKRLENWEHLDPDSPHFMCRDPLPGNALSGHALNMLTSTMFLSAVGKVAWRILQYQLFFETKQLPAFIPRNTTSDLNLRCKAFNFVGQKIGY